MECSDRCQEALEQTGADLGQHPRGHLGPDFVDQVSVDFQNRTSPWQAVKTSRVSQPRSWVGQKDSGSAIFFSDFNGFHVSGV